jgi:iron-sulfur cluster assembly protein
MAYALEFADSRGDEDEVFESQGISLFVSKKDMTYLSGLTLDFQKQGLNEGFAFLNPNETGRCGCGESFNV